MWAIKAFAPGAQVPIDQFPLQEAQRWIMFGWRESHGSINKYHHVYLQIAGPSPFWHQRIDAYNTAYTGETGRSIHKLQWYKLNKCRCSILNKQDFCCQHAAISFHRQSLENLGPFFVVGGTTDCGSCCLFFGLLVGLLICWSAGLCWLL